MLGSRVNPAVKPIFDWIDAALDSLYRRKKDKKNLLSQTVFLSFCLFVFLSFCLFVFLSLGEGRLLRVRVDRAILLEAADIVTALAVLVAPEVTLPGDLVALLAAEAEVGDVADLEGEQLER